MLVLEGVLLVGTGWLEVLLPLAGWNLGRLTLCRQCVLPFSLKRRFRCAPRRLLGSGLAFFCLNPGNDLLDLLALLHQLLPGMILSHFYLRYE